MRTDEARMLHLQAHLDRLEAIRAGRAFPPPPPPATRGKQRGSFNHEFLLRVGQYADGKMADNGPVVAREALVEWLDSQTREGHCSRGNAIETNSASHCQLNEAAGAVGLVFAEDRDDGPLIEKFRDWWWSEMVLCEEHAIPGRKNQPFDNKKGDRQPDVWGGGWRAMQKGKLIGSNACRCACWRIVYGHPMPSPKHRMWGQRYYLAARALKMLPDAELKALRPAAGFQPPLPYQLRVWRARDSFTTSWEGVPAGGDVARVAGFSPEKGPWVAEGVLALSNLPEPSSVYPGVRPLAQEGGTA